MARNGFTGSLVTTMVEVIIAVALLGTGFQHIAVANETAIETTIYGLVPLAVAVGVFYHIAKQFGIL
jgi:hypothetical protein